MQTVNPLSRREVIKFGAFTTVGGVLTPGISMAQAVVTDAKGITARDITLDVAGTKIPGYEARPEAPGRYPIVVAISGFTGMTEQHKDVVRRFAHAGFYAVTSELFHREGGMKDKPQPELARISASVGRAQYLRDIRAAVDHAKSQSFARADRIGVTGFCGGGALTLHFTADNPDVTAAVPWYGHLKRTYNDAPGVDAFSLVSKIKVPVPERRVRPLCRRAPRVLLRRPAAGLQEGRRGRRLEALHGVLRQDPQGVIA